MTDMVHRTPVHLPCNEIQMLSYLKFVRKFVGLSKRKVCIPSRVKMDHNAWWDFYPETLAVISLVRIFFFFNLSSRNCG